MEVNGVVIEDKATPLDEGTVILNLDYGRIGNRQTVSSQTDEISTEIDRKLLHLGVDLFDAPELRACHSFMAKLKRELRPYTVPSFFRGGMMLVKVEAVKEVDDLLKQAQADFIPLVKAFAEVVDQRREESKVRLKGAYNPKAYPTKGEVLTRFRIEYRWLSMATPTSLQKISMAIFDAEKSKAEDAIKAATAGITSLLAEEAKSLTDGLLEKLETGDDGKAKKLNQRRLDGITKFLSTFNLRNIGTSAELNAEVERMQKLLAGVDAKSLRSNDILRTTVQAGFAQVASELDKLIENKPTRYMETEGE